MSLIQYPLPAGYKAYRLVPVGHWDREAEDDEYFGKFEASIAAPSRAAAERFVHVYQLHFWLDASYPQIPEVSVNRVNVVVDANGGPKNPADALLARLKTRAERYIVRDTEGRLVVNPGNADGKTWLFTYLERLTRRHVSVIVEAHSAEKVLDEIADHPIGYGLKINPLELDAGEFAVYLKAGDVLPNTTIRVVDGSWLRLDGGIVADPERRIQYHEPYVDATGMFWPSSVYDGEMFWRIEGAEGAEVPFPVQYKLPSGAVVDPQSLARPPHCYVCDNEAREHLTQDNVPDAVFCSQKCIDYANSSFALLLYLDGKRRKAFRHRLYGPFSGLTAVRAFVDELRELPQYRNADDDFAEEIQLLPLTELIPEQQPLG